MIGKVTANGFVALFHENGDRVTKLDRKLGIIPCHIKYNKFTPFFSDPAGLEIQRDDAKKHNIPIIMTDEERRDLIDYLESRDKSMRASELITKLQQLITEYGDCTVDIQSEDGFNDIKIVNKYSYLDIGITVNEFALIWK